MSNLSRCKYHKQKKLLKFEPSVAPQTRPTKALVPNHTPPVQNLSHAESLFTINMANCNRFLTTSIVENQLLLAIEFARTVLMACLCLHEA